ncbi:bis(5'-nucleosyl)-tetraphosphatase (symmetrical) YqeK [Bacillus sp. B1-b2]|uniref:bis(5'-nucleosyl)-tetraphosphatase (symmetrical) YqeK n=1 Tax=Bacillus sp. B1-b2 TaxID=2653201 RepID=UPI00126276DF|nr:bis(5'-nucleosyl)-tetraphosphatase (symmetrical) YqeK [Bacillus sp. B1-b2]KAB7670107.1 HD domain-containing protein [Bacillus sp. B1-b2]
MNREDALALVKKQLTEKRYIHTIGVMDTAINLAERYGEVKKKAELAAIFHDYAKFRPLDEMKQVIVEQNMDPNLLLFHSELWHAPVGAYLVEQEAGIIDEDILGAIRFHTSGKPNMSLLEKIIYLADYIEPGRDFPGVNEVRELAKENLDKAFFQAVKNTIIYLIRNNRAVFPLSVDTYNYYSKKSGG